MYNLSKFLPLALIPSSRFKLVWRLSHFTASKFIVSQISEHLRRVVAASLRKYALPTSKFLSSQSFWFIHYRPFSYPRTFNCDILYLMLVNFVHIHPPTMFSSALSPLLLLLQVPPESPLCCICVCVYVCMYVRICILLKLHFSWQHTIFFLRFAYFA